jgi:hypothetical protein
MFLELITCQKINMREDINSVLFYKNTNKRRSTVNSVTVMVLE